jgi:hypothetical protein
MLGALKDAAGQPIKGIRVTLDPEAGNDKVSK